MKYRIAKFLTDFGFNSPPTMSAWQRGDGVGDLGVVELNVGKAHEAILIADEQGGHR